MSCVHTHRLFSMPINADSRAELIHALVPKNMPSVQLSDYEKELVLYVLGGSALLHKLPWPKLSKYGELYEMYVKYVLRHYDPQSTTIVL